MQRGQLAPGVGAELLGEHPARVLVRRQRLRRPSGRGERAHEEQPETFVEGVRGHQLDQVVDDGRRVSGRQGAGGATPGGGEAEGVPAGDVGGGVRGGPGVDQRLSTSQGEGLGVRPCRGSELSGGLRGVAPDDRGPQPVRVDVARRQHQPVARRLLHDRGGVPERAPQPRDERLQRVGGLGRRSVRPDRVDELVVADPAARVDREPAQQRPQPYARRRHVDPVAEHQQGPEQADADPAARLVAHRLLTEPR